MHRERLYSEEYQRVIIVTGRGVIENSGGRKWVRDTSDIYYYADLFVPFYG